MIKRRFSLLLVCMILVSIFTLPSTKVSAASGTKYLKVNNTTLEFNEIIYVDGTIGDDTNGDGSKDKPFKTIVKGFDYLSDNCREGGAIVIKDGTYDVMALFNGYMGWTLSRHYSGMKISLVAETMGNVTFLNVNRMEVISNNIKNRIKISSYGIRYNGYHGFYCIGEDDWTNEFYNCVFSSEYYADNSRVPNASLYTENCLFLGGPLDYAYKYPATGAAINCASESKYLVPHGGTKTDCLFNVTVDSNYNITSDGWKNAGTGTNPDGTNAHIGVYGGQFAWGSKATEVSSRTKLKVVLEPKEELHLSVEDDLEENTKMKWTSYNNSVATVDGNGVVTAVKPGNTVITVTNQDGSYTDIINVLVVEDAKDYRLAVDLKVGKSCRLTIDDATDTIPATWTSMDPTIATVSSKGKVTAVGKGLTIITATDADGNDIGQVYVRVRD